MAEPVRLRGEVGERRRGQEEKRFRPGDVRPMVLIDGEWTRCRRNVKRYFERRDTWDTSIAVRFDECIAIAKAPLLQALEEAQVRIASLEGRVAGLQEALELNLSKYRAQEGSYDEGA